MDLRRTILWSPTLGNAPFDLRVRAAADGGYPVLSVSPVDVQDAIDRGEDPLELRRWAEGLGVALPLMDGFADWYPHRVPKHSPMPPFDLEQFLALAVAFEVSTVVLVAPFLTDASIDAVTEGFANFCDRAARDGLAVALEFTPIPPVSSVEIAHKVLRDAGRPDTSMVFDVWHFFQGVPDFEALEAVPDGMITKCRVSDGFIGQFQESLVKDTFRHRLLPGQGEFELERVLQILDRKGGLDMCGPEVLSEELLAITASEAAAAAAKAFDELAERLRTA